MFGDERAIQAIAQAIDKSLNGEDRPKRNGFCLIVFPMKLDGRCYYISNAEREDAITMLKQQLMQFEEGTTGQVGHA